MLQLPYGGTQTETYTAFMQQLQWNTFHTDIDLRVFIARADT
jgi:hypothetical protein